MILIRWYRRRWFRAALKAARRRRTEARLAELREQLWQDYVHAKDYGEARRLLELLTRD